MHQLTRVVRRVVSTEAHPISPQHPSFVSSLPRRGLQREGRPPLPFDITLPFVHVVYHLASSRGPARKENKPEKIFEWRVAMMDVDTPSPPSPFVVSREATPSSSSAHSTHSTSMDLISSGPESIAGSSMSQGLPPSSATSASQDYGVDKFMERLSIEQVSILPIPYKSELICPGRLNGSANPSNWHRSKRALHLHGPP